MSASETTRFAPFRNALACAVFAALASFSTRPAFAQAEAQEPEPTEETKILNQRTQRRAGANAPLGFTLFFAADGGYAFEKRADTSLVDSKKGTHAVGKALASIYPGGWVVDLGVGWMINSVKGLETPAGAASGARKEIALSTMAGVLETAFRYRLDAGFQVGLVGQFLMGGDLGFDSRRQGGSSAFFGGAQAMYGIKGNTLDYRFGVEYLTDLGVAGTQIHAALLSLQLGLPLVRQDEIVNRKDVLNVKRRTEVEKVDRIITKVLVREVVRFRFDREQISFPDGRWEIGPEAQAFLLEMAAELGKESASWKDVIVQCHVTGTGDPQKDLQLSVRRAFAVRAALTAGGIPDARIRHQGFGNTQALPARPGGALPSRDRIELSFSGVTDMRALNDAVSRLQNLKSKPETCVDEECR